MPKTPLVCFYSWIVFLFVLLVSFKKTGENKKISIAYVGRYTDKKDEKARDNRFNRAHKHMLRTYVNELNEKLATEKKGVFLELKTFDSQCDPAESEKIYQKIAEDTSVISVIDNTWGAHIAGAAKVIHDRQIPLISINADHNFTLFGSQAIFTGNNDLLPGELNAFLKKIVRTKDVVFISEEDYPLHENYLAAFKRDSIHVASTFTIR